MNEGENRYQISLFSWQIKEVWHGQKPCKGERGSPSALVAMVSSAPSWLLLALQMLIIRVGLGGSGCGSLQGELGGAGILSWTDQTR